MTEREKTAAEKLAELRATQATRTERIEQAKTNQELADELALDPLRVQYGDRLSVLVPNAYVEGLPTMCASRPASGPEMKRYRDGVKVSVKESKTQVEGSAQAAELLADSTLVYPDAAMFAKMCEAFPGLKAGLGQEVVRRAQGKAEADAKS